MLKQILNLLILCGILFQGISGTSAETDIKKTSDVLVRHKRVFHSSISRDVSVTIQAAPYVVNIKTKNGSYELSHCVGTILTPHAVITAAQCACHSVESYAIYSQSSYSHTGTYHSVIDQKLHLSSLHQNTQHRAVDGVALMFVNPHFIIDSSTGTRYLTIRRGPIWPYSQATVSGWGYQCLTPTNPEPIVSLRQISVRTLDNVDCASRWHGLIQIASNDVCTFDARKHCGHSDLGAPLVIDRQLAGIHIFSGGISAVSPPKPDVFAFLDYPEYLHWIRTNILLHTK